MAHALYRFYGDAGVLLYVGITDNPHRRFGQHGKGKEWWPMVRGISIDWYETRAAVEAAERRAIAVEQPTHNKMLRRRFAPAEPRPTLELFSPDEMELIESVECAWTSFWWNELGRVNETVSRFRHDGRRYAPQPDDWPSVVAGLHRQGVTESDVFEAVRAIRAANQTRPEEMPADIMWRVFVELVHADDRAPSR